MKAAVIGGGAIGLAAALVLDHAGMQVSLFDPQGFELDEPAGEIGARVWALGPKAQGLLQRLSAWRSDSRLCAYQQMRVIDSSSDGAICFKDPHLGVLVEADWVRKRLLDRVLNSSIRCHVESVEAVSADGDLTGLAGESMTVDLAVLAEGRAARTAVASGFERIDGGHHQKALVATLAAEHCHGGEAFQIFTKEGPLALLPLPSVAEGHRVSLVWSVPETVADELSMLSLEALARRLTLRSESARGALSFVAPPEWIPLAQHRLKADAVGRCLAIGDTAHGILPLAGLGANLGFADVLALEAVVGAGVTDGARIARTVERNRRLDHRAVSLAMGLFSEGFRDTRPWVRLARSVALRTVDAHPSLRQAFQELAG